ncbi:MAG: YebC/PmpR family DNA-binding transcriptional regulator [Bacillota bacterium]
MGRKYEVRKESMAKTMIHKSKVYSRYGREIYVCAKNKGTNPESNLELKHLIERAKKDEVPMDIIERNIQKAESQDAADFEPARYEGFGPGGAAVIVDTLTDNVNRTVAEVRHCFTKTDSKLGVAGSVSYLYDHRSKVAITGVDEDTVIETLLEEDIDVEDIESHDDRLIVIADGYALDAIESVLSKHEAITIERSEKGWYPQNTVTLEGEDLEKFQKFLDMVNDVEDVQAVYHNVENI